MNFQQLRIIREAVRRDYNLTEVAHALFTSQPGVSKHIKDIEDELGVEIFVRRGKRVLGLTEPGKEMVEVVERMLLDAQNLQRIADQFSTAETGTLVIATTHIQSRYVLPTIIQRFRQRFPRVQLVLQQGGPHEIADWLLQDKADIGLASEGFSGVSELAIFDFHDWHHAVIVPESHPLATEGALTLQALADYPLVTYPPGMTGRNQIDQAFVSAGLTPDIVLSAIDSEVVKTYVEAGLGVGIITESAFDASKDTGLRCLAARELFAASTTRLALRRGRYLRGYVYRFIEQVIPALSEAEVVRALRLDTEEDTATLAVGIA